MENDIIQAEGFRIKCHSINTLIIGSGAASLNSAVSLHEMGQRDIIIATAKWGAGTSNNAGSDKQTYYKLSLSGRQPDSVVLMAQDLFNGRCMHGDIALCEAQGSVQAFMRLVNFGVQFPHDEYGAWAGYRTDYDPAARATSAGPYTSRMMFGALAREVRKRKIRVLDNHYIIELLTDSNRTIVVGALAIDMKEKDPFKSLVLFNSVNVVLGTGGPGDMYRDSVYPSSQTGSTGMALRAGATAQNLTESQFGIASLKFRWNLSGSYQQVIPRYYSSYGNDKSENEFLNDFFPDYTSLTKAIFLKGYQWPFDPSKAGNHGSSLIDLLVHRERTEKKRKVFIDFRRNPSWNGKDIFLPGNLDTEVRNYLSQSDSIKRSPVERLRSLNDPAYKLYLDHKIDLAAEPLEAGVCAQHNNGGLKGNIWWESDLKHLFPVGEVNGSHGVYRPGGSALNAGQVGSFRAASYISRYYNAGAPDMKKFTAEVMDNVIPVVNIAGIWLSAGSNRTWKVILSEIQQRMSEAAGIIREKNTVNKAAAEAYLLYRGIKNRLGASTVKELVECFRITDMCFLQMIYIEAVKSYIDRKGRSRGSYIVAENEEKLTRALTSGRPDIELCSYDRDVESDIQEVSYRRQKVRIEGVKVRSIPVQDLWFERVWKEYLEEYYTGG